MAVANTTVIELLGKFVSFEYVREMQLTEQSSITFCEKVSGKVDAVVFNLNALPEIAIEDRDFYSLCYLVDFKILDD